RTADANWVATKESNVQRSTNAHLACRRGSRRPRLTGVSRRRRAKSAAILTAELTRALIPNAVPRGRGIDCVRHQQAASFLQPQQLLILQRAHGGDAFEVGVE